MARADRDKMDSDDALIMPVMKIEIDVAEEPPVCWKTVKDEPGKRGTGLLLHFQ